jgi:hypothetical protein
MSGPRRVLAGPSVLKARPCRHDGMGVNVSRSTATWDMAVVAHTPNGEEVSIVVQLGTRRAK